MSTDGEKREWTSEDMVELISLYQTMPELWDKTSPEYRKKAKKLNSFRKLSKTFNTNITEMRRKIHNMRCQFTTELRRIKHTAERLNIHPSEIKTEWRYFHSLSYLLVNYREFQKGEFLDLQRSPFGENGDETNSLHYSREFPDSDEEKSENDTEPSTSKRIIPKSEEVYLDESEFHFKKKRKVSNEDHRLFGQYVALELRNLSDRGAKILKMKIRKAILEVTEEEFNMENGHEEYLEFDA